LPWPSSRLTPQQAEALTFEAFKEFARGHHYTQSKHLVNSYARLQRPQPQALPGIVGAYQEEAVGLAEMALGAVRQRIRAMARLETLYIQHPDYATFHSLPQAGAFLEPALLAMFGEDRARFPTSNSVQVQAGTCPATERSGKRREVSFRRACDRDFQAIAQQWAKASLGSSVWANTYMITARVHARSENHALRCLANRWLAILWRLWMDHQPYDEITHLERHSRRAQAKA
jgi:hypothetical protein